MVNYLLISFPPNIKAIVLAVLFALLASGLYSQSKCIDSLISYRLFNEKWDSVGAVNFQPFRSGRFLLGLFEEGALQSKRYELVSGDEKNIYWVKSWSSGNSTIKMISSYEFENGDILIHGLTDNKGEYRTFILRMDARGNIIWINYYRGLIRFTLKEVLEYPNGNFLVSSLIDSGIGMILFDPNGNIIWTSEYHYEKVEEVFDLETYTMAKESDSTAIILISPYWSSDNFGLFIKSSIFTLRLNILSGKILQSRRYTSTVKGVLLLRDLNFVNGELTLWANGVINSKSTIHRITLDGNLNNLGNSVMVGPNGYKNSLFYILSEEKANGSLGVFTLGLNSSVFYYFTINDKFKFNLFRKVNFNSWFANIKPSLQRNARLNFFVSFENKFKPFFKSLYFPSSFSGNSECFGTDTSSFFSPVSPLTFTTSPAAISQTSFLLNPVKPGIEITLSDYEISRTEDCKEVSICDSIRIKGPETICDPDKSLVFHIEKRTDCLKEIDWDIDSSAIEKMEFQGRDSVKILFEKEWKGGYLKASIPSCNIRDSFKITVPDKLPALNLGADTSLCRDSIILKAQKGYTDYQWQNGNNNDSLIVYSPGRYWVQVNDGCGQSFADTILVSAPDLYFSAGNSKSICEGDTATLSATMGFQNYRWMPDASVSDPHRTNVSVSPDTTTRYFVSAEKFAGCFVGDSVTVEVKDCPVSIFFPNAFSPNNDGLNDLFKPVISRNPKSFRISVFNRNGQVVYHSEKPDGGWDGRYKGELQPAGVYVWTCEYSFPRQKPHRLKGELVLLK